MHVPDLFFKPVLNLGHNHSGPLEIHIAAENLMQLSYCPKKLTALFPSRKFVKMIIP